MIDHSEELIDRLETEARQAQQIVDRINLLNAVAREIGPYGDGEISPVIRERVRRYYQENHEWDDSE